MQPGEKTTTPPAETSGEQQTISNTLSPEDIGNSPDAANPTLTEKVKSIVRDFVDYAKNTDL